MGPGTSTQLKACLSVFCFYVRLNEDRDTIHRAVYIQEKTLQSLTNKCRVKFACDPGSHLHFTRINSQGFRVLVTEHSLSQLPDGQDLIMDIMACENEHAQGDSNQQDTRHDGPTDLEKRLDPVIETQYSESFVDMNYSFDALMVANPDEYLVPAFDTPESQYDQVNMSCTRQNLWPEPSSASRQSIMAMFESGWSELLQMQQTWSRSWGQTRSSRAEFSHASECSASKAWQRINGCDYETYTEHSSPAISGGFTPVDIMTAATPDDMLSTTCMAEPRHNVAEMPASQPMSNLSGQGKRPSRGCRLRKRSTGESRQRNREAAARCRARRKGEEVDMLERIHKMKLGNQELRTAIHELQMQVVLMKSLLVQHGSCIGDERSLASMT
ncbi:hypothetical protein LTS08_008102 [Lithohypha guttulata]|uniref:uncharacterized protein n=1 Tax=Lithohypha guttulata TaxID=1690604 RepID=UPI002DE08D99|nr:hypothetical protein LTR51_005047 [Lithohypha guttulata]KAK5095460.1 hypothetical protein LTS08_008102 [Lithohypha guttulata]